MQVWVLTGDKPETAINIAYSCKLLDHEDLVFTFSTNRKVVDLTLCHSVLTNAFITEQTRHSFQWFWLPLVNQPHQKNYAQHRINILKSNLFNRINHISIWACWWFLMCLGFKTLNPHKRKRVNWFIWDNRGFSVTQFHPLKSEVLHSVLKHINALAIICQICCFSFHVCLSLCLRELRKSAFTILNGSYCCSVIPFSHFWGGQETVLVSFQH